MQLNLTSQKEKDKRIKEAGKLDADKPEAGKPQALKPS